jgi:hypothetical protein
MVSNQAFSDKPPRALTISAAAEISAAFKGSRGWLFMAYLSEECPATLPE